LNLKKTDIRIWGNEAPNLVFLHYFGGEAESWFRVGEKLQDQYRCIALSLPGFGGTPPLEKPSIIAMALWVQKQLALHDIYDFSLVGHSMGGKIAVQLAALPDELEVHRLILLAPSPPGVEPMPEAEKQRMLKHPDSEEAQKTVENATIKKLPADIMEFAIQTQLRIHHPTWRWWLEKGMDHSIAATAAQLTCPVHVITSENDPVISMQTIREEVLPNLPEAELISLQGAGHLLPFEVPGTISEHISKLVMV
jgi:pimeloyl-ACP methyl ester carboxylesterase